MEGRRPAERADVGVVLLDYDGGETLIRCIRSLARQTVVPARLLIVDNGGTGFDRGAIARELGHRFVPVLAFERIEQNEGYVRGMNHGLQRLLSDVAAPGWLMTLSNDTEFDAAFIENLARAVVRAPGTVGMIAPKLRSAAERDRLDGAGIAVSLDGMSTARGQRESDRGQYDSAPSAICPNGVAAVYRAELLREVGLLDEDFWAYCEDTDLGLRAWLAGWDCAFAADCLIYHARSSTMGEHSLRKLYLVERNHFWVALKNLPVPLLAMNPAFTSYRYLVQLYSLLSKRGQGRGYSETHRPVELVRETLRALFDAGKGAPGAMRKRLATRRLRRRSLKDQLRVLWGERLPFADLILK